MKLLILALIAIPLLNTALAADDEFMKGGLKKRGTSIELRAKCAVNDAAGDCLLVNLFLNGTKRVGGETLAPVQITAYPLAISDINKLKTKGVFLNLFTTDESSMTSQLNGIEFVFAPITAIADIAGYTAATPFFLVAKTVENRKYNKFIRAFRNEKSLEMNHQPFDILSEEICLSGFRARLHEVAAENDIILPASREEQKRLDQLMQQFSSCGAN